MPDMTPVANQVNPPDPMKGLNTFSGILGLKRQQQELTLGQQQIQTGQANLQQTQQKNSELQNLSQFVQKAIKDPDYQLQDGSPDIQKFQRDAMGVAPTYGQQYIGQTTSNFKEAVETRRSLQGLSSDQNEAISKALKGIATNPNATPTDLLDAVTQLRSNNKDPGFNRALDNFLLGAARGSPQQAAANGASILGGLAQTTPAQVDQGGSVVPGARTELGPGVGTFTPAGAKVGKTLAPQVVSPPGGVPVAVGGAGGGVGGSGGRNLSGFPGPQPTDQDMKNFADYSGNLNSRVAVAADTVPRLNLVEAAADNIRTGGGAQVRANLARRAQALGLPQNAVDAIAGGNLAQVQETEKMLFQTTMSGLRQAMQGDSAHVAEFQAAERVFPTIDTDPRARQRILGFIRDQSQRDFAEQQSLNDARKRGTFNPVTWQADYQQQLRSGQVPGVPKSQVPESKTVVRRGTYNGRKVAEYSDGTHGYID